MNCDKLLSTSRIHFQLVYPTHKHTRTLIHTPLQPTGPTNRAERKNYMAYLQPCTDRAIFASFNATFCTNGISSGHVIATCLLLYSFENICIKRYRNAGIWKEQWICICRYFQTSNWKLVKWNLFKYWIVGSRVLCRTGGFNSRNHINQGHKRTTIDKNVVISFVHSLMLLDERLILYSSGAFGNITFILFTLCCFYLCSIRFPASQLLSLYFVDTYSEVFIAVKEAQSGRSSIKCWKSFFVHWINQLSYLFTIVKSKTQTKLKSFTV